MWRVGVVEGRPGGGVSRLANPWSHRRERRCVTKNRVAPVLFGTVFTIRVLLNWSNEGCGKLPTPQYLGMDACTIQQGHRSATILCAVEHRQVLDVCRGREKEEVVRLLQRLDHPERVEAVSLDMRASFAPAVRQALPHAQ